MRPWSMGSTQSPWRPPRRHERSGIRFQPTGHRLEPDVTAHSWFLMNNPAVQDDASLLFEWAPPKGEKFLISTFLVGSLILHALAFYLFRIIYPPAIAVLPPPA